MNMQEIEKYISYIKKIRQDDESIIVEDGLVSIFVDDLKIKTDFDKLYQIVGEEDKFKYLTSPEDLLHFIIFRTVKEKGIAIYPFSWLIQLDDLSAKSLKSLKLIADKNNVSLDLLFNRVSTFYGSPQEISDFTGVYLSLVKELRTLNHQSILKNILKES